jgi:hypothetical protein
MNTIPESGPPPENRQSPAPRWAHVRAGWRRRVPIYLLLGVGAFLFVQFLERRPRDLDVFFVLTQLEVKAATARLDRAHLVELSAEIRADDELLATTTWSFRPGGAPLKVGPAHVRLRPGHYDVHFRLTFELPQGDRRLFALRRRAQVDAESEYLLIDVTG